MVLGTKHRQQQAKEQHHQTQTNHNYNWKWREMVIKHNLDSCLCDNVHADIQELTFSFRKWSPPVTLHSQWATTYPSNCHCVLFYYEKSQDQTVQYYTNHDLSIIEIPAQGRFDQSQPIHVKHDNREQNGSENLRTCCNICQTQKTVCDHISKHWEESWRLHSFRVIWIRISYPRSVWIMVHQWKKPMNPWPEWIHRFLWCTMIQTDLGSLILIQITPKERTLNSSYHLYLILKTQSGSFLHWTSL